MENNYINIVIILVYLRRDIRKPYNTKIIDYMLSWISNEITAKELIELVKQLGVEWWDNLKPENHLFIKNDFRNKFIDYTLKYLRDLIQQSQYDKAYCVTDILHVFPDVILNNAKSTKAFWKHYILPFKKNFKDDFFDEFRLIFTTGL